MIRLGRTFQTFALLLSLAVSLILAGCGGGGPSAKVTYQTQWTSVTGALQSQDVRLYDATGRMVSRRTVNQKGTDVFTINLTAIATGNYRIHVDLYTGKNLSGTLKGYLDKFGSASSALPINLRSVVGGIPTALNISPADTTLPLDSSQQLYVSGQTIDGLLTFVKAGGLDWTTTGGTVTVSSTGKVVATGIGTSTVKASDPSSTAFGQVTVTVPSPPRKKWTIMVFLDASNDLQPFSELNMNQMELLGDSDDVQFIVQWKQYKKISPTAIFDGTRRYYIKKDSSNSSVRSAMIQDLGTSVDMGNAATLRQFVDWSKAHYPSDHTALVMWDHGNGWLPFRSLTPKSRAIHVDNQFGTAMDIWDIRTAMAGQHVDMVFTDACLMNQLEIANDFKSFTDAMVGSEELTPLQGYVYQNCFKQFFTAPDSNLLSMAKVVCDAQVDDPNYAKSGEMITQSYIDLTQLDGLNSAVDALAGALIANKPSMGTTMGHVRTNAERFDQAVSSEHFYDLYDVCDKLIADASCPAAVKTAAANVQAAFVSAVPYERHTSNRSASHGIAIDLTPGSKYDGASYGKLQFGQTNRWAQWLAIAP